MVSVNYACAGAAVRCWLMVYLSTSELLKQGTERKLLPRYGVTCAAKKSKRFDQTETLCLTFAIRSTVLQLTAQVVATARRVQDTST